MVFSSPIFLYLFLPVTLILTWITHKWKVRNLVLLLLSIFFYMFGEGEMILLMIGSVTMNYFMGVWIGGSHSRMPLAIGVTLNLLALVIYKYTAFFISNINQLLALYSDVQIRQVKVRLPAGISFYTFHALSYLIDVYRGKNKAQKSFIDLALYICLFPQLIAGPIIRYKDVAWQFANRVLNSGMFRSGIERFIIGLGKKVIIANTLALGADEAFGVNPAELTTGGAWFGMACYTMQLYFDFSAYSDMAIGLGKMLGFSFLENFNFPYKAKSVREFWQRWHISLSNWFRDYLYVPLGGNRVGAGRTYVNLYIVFFLTGLWHGPSWNFVIWGLMHGTFMVIERVGFGKWLDRMPSIIGHVYTLLAVMLLWVFFRASDLPASVGFIKALFGVNDHGIYTAAMFSDQEIWFTFILAIIMSFNGFNAVLKKIYITANRSLAVIPATRALFRGSRTAFLLFVLIFSGMVIATGSYNPFIYFRF